MRFWKNVLAMLMVVGLAGAAFAADKPEKVSKADKAATDKPEKAKKAKEKVLRGVISSVDGNTLKVKPNPQKDQAEPAELVIATDANTIIKVDGKPAKLADLKPNTRIIITPATGTATKIDVKTQPAKPEAPKKKDAEKQPKKKQEKAEKA